MPSDSERSAALRHDPARSAASESALAIELLPGRVVVEGLPWQSRKDSPILPEAATPAEPLGDESFQQSIVSRGVIQAPKVCRLAVNLVAQDGRPSEWGVVAGFRRLRAAYKVAPERPVTCVIKPPAEDETSEDKERRSDNLIENVQRRDIRPWEVAEWLFDFKEAHPGVTIEELAERSSLGETYCLYLLRIRALSCPEVWEHFKRYAAGRVSYKVMLEIVRLPKNDQLAAWNKFIADQDKRGPRGKEKKPGPIKLAKWLGQVEHGLFLHEHKEYRRAAKKVLRCALGLEPWPGPKAKGGRDAGRAQS